MAKTDLESQRRSSWPHTRNFSGLAGLADIGVLATEGEGEWLAVADRDLFLLAKQWAFRG